MDSSVIAAFMEASEMAIGLLMVHGELRWQIGPMFSESSMDKGVLSGKFSATLLREGNSWLLKIEGPAIYIPSGQ